MVEAMTSVALVAWQIEVGNAGREEVFQHFINVPFSQLIEKGVALYQQVLGDPAETDWTSGGDAAVALFARDYPIFLRAREDVKTLERVASVFGFRNVGAYRSAMDEIVDLCEEGRVLAQVLRSVLAGVAMGFQKPWLTLYPDGMLRVLRTLYLDRAQGLEAPWVRTVSPDVALNVYLSGHQSAALTVLDREMIVSHLRDAVTELQRLWDDPEYLSAMLACPVLDTFYTGKQSFFRDAFFDTGKQTFDGDHCAGTPEWDLTAFNLPAWVIFLEKASGVPFVGDEDDEDVLLEYLRNQSVRANEHPLQWELAASFLLTDAPWFPLMREHLTLVLDTLKRAMEVIQAHGCAEDHIHATLAVLNGLEYGPQAQD
uniref:Uncharacterized protein n=1 Tax=mine drainage metagenome TaxID=410659 RepID=E6QLZ7_9ZZZZ